MKNIYQVDPSHSVASFSIKYMMIAEVRGAFERMKGRLIYDPEEVSTSSVEVEIEAASINTYEPRRDLHLKGPVFFDVAKYPVVAFKSRRVEGLSPHLRVVGDLSLHGVTRPVVLEVEGPSYEGKDPWGNIKIGAAGSTQISRKDFGLSWNAVLEVWGFLVADEIQITLEVQFVKQEQKSKRPS